MGPAGRRGGPAVTRCSLSYDFPSCNETPTWASTTACQSYRPRLPEPRSQSEPSLRCDRTDQRSDWPGPGPPGLIPAGTQLGDGAPLKVKLGVRICWVELYVVVHVTIVKQTVNGTAIMLESDKPTWQDGEKLPRLTAQLSRAAMIPASLSHGDIGQGTTFPTACNARPGGRRDQRSVRARGLQWRMGKGMRRQSARGGGTARRQRRKSCFTDTF
eukprot:747684-Hanusia_phi.AAC.1